MLSDRKMTIQDLQTGRRAFLIGASLLTGRLLLPGTAFARERRSTSQFGSDQTALQAAFDWAHATGGELVLNNDITVRGTVFMGSVTLLDGGGRIMIRGDRTFSIEKRAGRWSKRGAILMRSARGNSLYAAPLETTYDVEIGPGVRVEFVRSSPTAPEAPFLFTGLSHLSRIAMDFAGFSEDGNVCNGPDFYFYNRAAIAGNYRLTFDTSTAIGGFWFRDVDEQRLGPEYRSDFQFANPQFAKTGGEDECVAIYTLRRAPGHIRARGSLTVSQSNGLGFSILNNSGAADQNFDIELTQVRVQSTTKPRQPVFKIRDSAPRIDRIEAVFVGAEKADETAYVLRCIRRSKEGNVPRIGEALLVNESTGKAKPIGLDGECSIGRMRTIGL